VNKALLCRGARSFRQVIRAEKEIPGWHTAWPNHCLGPGFLAHRLKNGEAGFPVSRSHDWREPGGGLTVTGEHNVLPRFGAAHKFGKPGFGVAY
jgi:hypothetical protein